MQPSNKAYELIKSFEGLRCRAYKALPQEKFFTIGYGHCGKEVAKNQIITPQKAEELLKDDVQIIADKLGKDTPFLTQCQFDALCSFIYNVGWYAYRYSMTRENVRQLNLSKVETDCTEKMILWIRCQGKVILGLQKRRVLEANHFLGREHYRLNDGIITTV